MCVYRRSLECCKLPFFFLFVFFVFFVQPPDPPILTKRAMWRSLCSCYPALLTTLPLISQHASGTRHKPSQRGGPETANAGIAAKERNKKRENSGGSLQKSLHLKITVIAQPTYSPRNLQQHGPSFTHMHLFSNQKYVRTHL